MWLCLSDGFLSIVDKAETTGCLVVRARREGDIERYFPGAKVKKTPGNDYLFRAEIPRTEVADVVAELVMGITYDNFKNSVRNRPLHDAFARIWSVMSGLQPIAPYARGRAQKRLPL